MTPPAPYRIAYLPPPGKSVRTALPLADPRCQPSTSTAPSLFHDALAVRIPVFIHKQGCGDELEIDEADECSAHWVIYSKTDESALDVPAATIRCTPGHPLNRHEGSSLKGEERFGGPDVNGDPDYEGSDWEGWDKRESFGLVGRLATRKEFRGRGYAGLLMRVALEWAERERKEGEDRRKIESGTGKGGEGEAGGEEWKGLMLIHAQMYLEKWYAGFGFEADRGMGKWWEEGIKHVAMWKRL